MTDERTGLPFVACFPLAPDVAVVHVHEADVLGNARVNPKLVWLDGELVKAARKVIVTAERIVDTDTFRDAPELTCYTSYAVDHVAHAPRSAWPGGSAPDYGYDADFYRAYTTAAKDAAAFATLFAEAVGSIPRPAGGTSR